MYNRDQVILTTDKYGAARKVELVKVDGTRVELICSSISPSFKPSNMNLVNIDLDAEFVQVVEESEYV